MSENELNREQLLDEMILLSAAIEHGGDAEHAVNRLEELAERLQASWGNGTRKETRGPRSLADVIEDGRPDPIRRADPEEIEKWEDPYAREPREPHRWDRDLTPEELAKRAERWIRIQKERKEAEKNLPRRLRLECFLNDWRTAVVTKKVEKDEDIEKLWTELCLNGSEDSRWSSVDTGLTDDIAKIEDAMKKYGPTVDFAVAELRKSKAHPSLTTHELMHVTVDWKPDVSLEALPGAFGEWPEPSPKDPIKAGVEAHLLASVLFDDPSKAKEKVTNDIAAQLMAELDANPLGELDLQRVQLFRRLASLSLELAEVTGELFQPHEETEFEKERKQRVKEQKATGVAVKRAEDVSEPEPEVEPDDNIEDGLGWKAPLASLLVAAVAKAAQTHFEQKAEESIEEDVEVKHGS